jgi:hypothetical protein
MSEEKEATRKALEATVFRAMRETRHLPEGERLEEVKKACSGTRKGILMPVEGEAHRDQTTDFPTATSGAGGGVSVGVVATTDYVQACLLLEEGCKECHGHGLVAAESGSAGMFRKCVACNGAGKAITPFGQAVLDFVFSKLRLDLRR